MSRSLSRAGPWAGIAGLAIAALIAGAGTAIDLAIALAPAPAPALDMSQALRSPSEDSRSHSAAAGSAALGRLDRAYVLDGFERDDWPDPALWTLPTAPAQAWRPSACRAASGSRALRAFGGSGAVEAPCNGPALTPGASESVIELQLDLRGAATAHRLDLEFELWLGLPPSAGGEGGAGALFIELLVPRGSDIVPVTIFGGTGASGIWTYPNRRLDLTALVDVASPLDVYDLRGGRWTMRLRAVPSAPSAPTIGDVYIDELRLVWEPDLAVPTPTPRPISTATPAPSATPTPTPRPSITPEPTPSNPPADVWTAHLPWLARAYPSPEPSPEPSATPTADGSTTPGSPTATPTATVTAMATATTSPSPTATPAARRYLPSVELGRPPDAYPGP